MKKCFLLFIIFFLFTINVNASTYQGTITGTDVSLRTGPGTNYAKISFTLYKNQTYNMPDNTLYKTESGCNSGYWYKLNYDGTKMGYVCSSYVSVSQIVINQTPTNECEEDLKNKGFPATYWAGLCSLKSAHSNWNFNSIITNLEWSEAVSKESTCGKSYIASTDPNNINYACNNQYTSTWYPASSSAVAYYMDPRNFFSEKYIFQFEYLKYDSSISYVSAVSTLLQNAAFYQYHGAILGTSIDNVGKNNDLSPIFMASRMLQELGSSTKLYNLYSGVYPSYEGYYNFYNIGVSDSCATTYGTTACGLNYAKNNGWYGLEAAINGGASFIANRYVAKGQFTTYLQKYNVKPTNQSNLYLNQYMTNVAAPSSESSSTYNSYSKLGLLSNAFTFYIPVYKNMDDSNYTDDGANPDNNESNLSATDINTIITSSGYRSNGSYLEAVSPLTLVTTLKSRIEAISGTNSVNVTNVNGSSVTTGYIGTGYKVTIKNKDTSKTYVVIINGDTSGDGVINALDLLQVQKHILGTYTLQNIYFNAGDTNNDGQITALDLLQVQKHILGSYIIIQ